jgi:hypothetical protein
MYIEERQGYIIDDMFGFTKNKQGLYVPTDLETGLLLLVPNSQFYSLVKAYVITKRTFDAHKTNYELVRILDEDTKEAAKMVETYYAERKVT